MLTEQQCNLVERGLTEDVEPRKVAAYLCLRMGLMLSEVSALRWRDIDLDAGTLSIVHIIGRQSSSMPTIPETCPCRESCCPICVRPGSSIPAAIASS